MPEIGTRVGVMTSDGRVEDRGAAFTRLLEEQKDSLYAFAKSLIWNKEGAEDALQDAVIAAYRAFDTFELGTNFRAWMFRFIVNTIFNLNKKTRRSVEVPLTQDDVQVLESPNPPDLGPTLLLDPTGYLDLVSDPVRRAVLRLPESQRMAFLLRTVNEFSYKEISRILGAPLGTVMSLLCRARVKLRAELVDFETDTGK